MLNSPIDVPSIFYTSKYLSFIHVVVTLSGPKMIDVNLIFTKNVIELVGLVLSYEKVPLYFESYSSIFYRLWPALAKSVILVEHTHHDSCMRPTHMKRNTNVMLTAHTTTMNCIDFDLVPACALASWIITN
jgi:hypothetical protein